MHNDGSWGWYAFTGPEDQFLTALLEQLSPTTLKAIRFRLKNEVRAQRACDVFLESQTPPLTDASVPPRRPPPAARH